MGVVRDVLETLGIVRNPAFPKNKLPHRRTKPPKLCTDGGEHDWELFTMPNRFALQCPEMTHTWTYRCRKCPHYRERKTGPIG